MVVVRRLIAALVAMATGAGLTVGYAPIAQAARPPIVMTAPGETPAYSSFPLEVVVPKATQANAPARRTATLTASRW